VLSFLHGSLARVVIRGFRIIYQRGNRREAIKAECPNS